MDFAKGANPPKVGLADFSSDFLASSTQRSCALAGPASKALALRMEVPHRLSGQQKLGANACSPLASFPDGDLRLIAEIRLATAPNRVPELRDVTRDEPRLANQLAAYLQGLPLMVKTVAAEFVQVVPKLTDPAKWLDQSVLVY